MVALPILAVGLAAALASAQAQAPAIARQTAPQEGQDPGQELGQAAEQEPGQGREQEAGQDAAQGPGDDQAGPAPADGWVLADGHWRYLVAGEPASGWVLSGGRWYLLGEGGERLRGWQRAEGGWYYLMPDGAMATGWLCLGGAWYHLADTGEMARGWREVGGTWYCFSDSGAMLADATTPDGCRVGADGAWDGRSAAEVAFVDEWTARVDRYLAGTPMAGCGKHYAQAAWDYGVDPRVLPAISRNESGCGKACWYPYNAWGWMAPLGNSWAESIDMITRKFKAGYGYTMTYAGARRYAANGMEGRWLSIVYGEMAKI